MAGPGMFQSQNLSLQQVLAPQLQQSLLILQAPLLELRNLVQQEMETNPVLEELAEATDEERKVSESEPAEEDKFKEEFDQLAKLDDEWRDYMAQSGSYSGRSKEEEDKRQFFFDSIATQETLQQHLVAQLNQTALNADDRKHLQSLLLRKGYEIGNPDGVIGPKTRAAVIDWQSRSGLLPDGHVSGNLLRALS